MADVYFAALRARGGPHESKIAKIRRLFDAAGFDGGAIRPGGDLAAVKLHVGGERGGATPTSTRSLPGRWSIR